MKKHQNKIMTALFVLVLAAYAGKSHIRNWFAPKMKFASATFTTIDTNKPTTIDDLKGNVIIVSCYQTWCIDCARETPDLNQLAAEINAANFKVVYISDEEAGLVTQFRQRFPSDKIMFTKSAEPLSALGISVFPTTFLVNKNGKVVTTKLGGHNWLSEKETIQKMMAE